MEKFKFCQSNGSLYHLIEIAFSNNSLIVNDCTVIFVETSIIMAIGTVFDPENFNAVPLPKELPSIDLPKISIAKLLEGDHEEAKTVFDICSRTGFFYLDLMDHPLGRKLWENACIARNVGQEGMSRLPMEDKDRFLRRPEVGILDRGFQSTIRDENGQTKFVESINVS